MGLARISHQDFGFRCICSVSECTSGLKSIAIAMVWGKMRAQERYRCAWNEIASRQTDCIWLKSSFGFYHHDVIRIFQRPGEKCGLDMIWRITSWVQIWTDTPKNKFKNNSPQRHRGHREKLCIINSAAGAVNKVNLCASVVRCF